MNNTNNTNNSATNYAISEGLCSILHYIGISDTIVNVIYDKISLIILMFNTVFEKLNNICNIFENFIYFAMELFEKCTRIKIELSYKEISSSGVIPNHFEIHSSSFENQNNQNNQNLNNALLESFTFTNNNNETVQEDNSLENHIVKRESIQSDLDNNCAVCLDSLDENNCVGELKCKHTFHYDCIKKWVHISANCPICKNDIKNTPVITNSNQSRRNPRRKTIRNSNNNQNTHNTRNQRRRNRRIYLESQS